MSFKWLWKYRFWHVSLCFDGKQNHVDTLFCTLLQILNEIAQHKIKIYDFPEPLDEEEDAKTLRQLRSRVPYAVVGANTIIEIDGRKVRGRRYPWGVAEGLLKASVIPCVQCRT